MNPGSVALCMLVKCSSLEASDLLADRHVDICGENSPKTQVKCAGEQIPQTGQSVLIYGLLPFPFEYKPEPMHRMVLFRLVNL